MQFYINPLIDKENCKFFLTQVPGDQSWGVAIYLSILTNIYSSQVKLGDASFPVNTDRKN